MNLKTKSLVLTTLAVVSVMVITSAITYAFFNYAKEGTTDNVITTGSLTFLYTEVSGVGNGIEIENAFPISDEVGKVQTGEREYFDFKITSTTENNTIPYEVTARKSSDSDDIDESIRVYLTKGDEEVLLDNYSNLTQTTKVEESKYTEKVIYTDTVLANTNYEETFRLRMWIDEETDFSDGIMNDKTFTLTVNVYANAEVVSGLQTMTADTVLSIGEAVTAVDGSKWHVLEASDENTETVLLLSDYNLNSDGTYNTECGRDINSTYRCSTMAYDPDNAFSYNETDSNNIAYFIKNTYEPLVIKKLPGTTNVTIPTAAQIFTAAGSTFTNSGTQKNLTSSWFTTTNYWTKTSHSTISPALWYIFGEGLYAGVDRPLTNNDFGARPVITTPKTNLLSKHGLNTNISSLLLDNTSLTAVEGEDYDYIAILPEGTTSATINVETENPNATVTVEKIDSLASTNNVKRLAVAKELELTEGFNYFKVTVTSQNKIENAEYKIKIYVGSNMVYSIGDAVTAIDGSKWHVLEASDYDMKTVVLLSDYNLNSDGTYNTECGRDINSTYRCSTMAYDPNNTSAYNETDSNNIAYFIKNTYEPLVTKALPGTTNVTIPTAAQIVTANGLTFTNSGIKQTLISSWVTTTNYWTKTAGASYPSYLWYIFGEGLYAGLDHSSTTTTFGARPVITTPKTNLISQ